MTQPSKSGRREHAFGDLYELFEEKFPKLRTERNTFNVQAFAALLGYSNETVYKALREFQPLKLGVAVRILETAAENRDAVTMYWPDLLPYLLPNYPDHMQPVAGKTPATGEIDDLLG